MYNSHPRRRGERGEKIFEEIVVQKFSFFKSVNSNSLYNPKQGIKEVNSKQIMIELYKHRERKKFSLKKK